MLLMNLVGRDRLHLWRTVHGLIISCCVCLSGGGGDSFPFPLGKILLPFPPRGFSPLPSGRFSYPLPQWDSPLSTGGDCHSLPGEGEESSGEDCLPLPRGGNLFPVPGEILFLPLGNSLHSLFLPGIILVFPWGIILSFPMGSFLPFPWLGFSFLPSFPFL
jgi:hypothetical protein